MTKLKIAECLDCGKEFRYYPSATKGKYCSRKCAQTSNENINHLRIVGEPHRQNKKTSDAVLLQMWAYLKTGRYSTLTEALKSLGLTALNRRRMKALVGDLEYKRVMTQVKSRPQARKVGKMYQKGVHRERQALKRLYNEGYYAIRAAGSRGIWDIWALNSECLKLIQVKSTKSNRRAEIMYKDDIRKMQLVESPSQQELWIWRDSQGWEIYQITKDGILLLE